MYKSIILLIIGLIFFNCGNSQEKTSFNDEALSEVLINLNKEEISFKEILDNHLGKIVLVDVWASWCPDCINGMPKLKALQNQFPELQMVYLSYDKTHEALISAIEKYDLKGEHYLLKSSWKGGDFRKHIDLDWIPRYILIDKTGKIIKYRSIEADDEALIKTIKNL